VNEPPRTVNEPPWPWGDEVDGGDALMQDLLSAALDEVAPSAVRERAHQVVESLLARGAFEVNTVSGVFDTGAPQGDAGSGAVEPMVSDTTPLPPLLPSPGMPANDPARGRARARLASVMRGIATSAQASAAVRRLSGVAQLAAAVAVGVAAAHAAHFARTTALDACHARAADVACPALCDIAPGSAAVVPVPRSVEPTALLAASAFGLPPEAPSTGVAALERGSDVPAGRRDTGGDDWLGRQLSLLSRAEKSLNAGDGAGARHALDEYARRYPRGLLDPQVAQLRQRVDLSPPQRADLSPRGGADLSRRERADLSPRGGADLSRRERAPRR
jgi:hypothetical protein